MQLRANIASQKKHQTLRNRRNKLYEPALDDLKKGRDNDDESQIS